MSKLNSLILLINSLSKAEKKSISLRSNQSSSPKAYMGLFDIIEKNKNNNNIDIPAEFQKAYPNSTLGPTASYLFDLILQKLVDLEINKDNDFKLYNEYLKVRMLKNRNLHNDFSSALSKLKKDSEAIGNYNLLLTARRLELNNSLFDRFDGLQESDLIKKQHKINDTLKIIRQINEQSLLYEMLRFRSEKLSAIGSVDTNSYNDLVISELSLVSNLKKDIFEIDKLHRLFQANYYISIGNYKTAINAFAELNKLFQNNKHLWNNPPYYYVMVLEGVLESLKRIGEFESMPIYLEQLRTLATEFPYADFTVSIHTIDFINSTAPYLAANQHKKAMDLIEVYKEKLIKKTDLLQPIQYLQLSAHLALIYLVNSEFKKGRSILHPIIQNDIYEDIWVYKPIQLINLAICYKNKDFEYITSAIRSIKRRNKKTGKGTKAEEIFFKFIQLDLRPLPQKKREDIIQKFNQEIDSLKISIEERRILHVFDFRTWIRYNLT